MMGELAVRAWVKGWVPRREMNRREDTDCRSVCSEVLEYYSNVGKNLEDFGYF